MEDQSPYGGELGIFPSPRAFIQGESYIRQLAPRFAPCFALLVPRAYTRGEAQNFSKSQSLYEESSEFFQFPGPLYREKSLYDDSHLVLLGALLFYFPEPHISSYFPHIPSYFPHISSCSFIFSSCILTKSHRQRGDTHGFPIVTRVSRKKVGLRKFKTVSYQLCCNPLLFIYTTLVRTIE